MDREFWNEAFKSDPAQTMVADYVLAHEVTGPPVGKALDLGCGSGENALMLAERGWSVVGVDWAEHAIELAAAAARERELDAEFVVGDTTLWEPQTTFDLVISTYALPGGDATRRALHTAVHALAPGGTLIVVEWDRSMCDVWGSAEDELPSPEQIVAHLPGLSIERAEVQRIDNAFPSADDPRGLQGASANVAIVRARMP